MVELKRIRRSTNYVRGIMEYDILSQIIAYAPDKIDTETKARAMVQGPRNMYNQGQLVSPSVDGSRPGYSGR